MDDFPEYFDPATLTELEGLHLRARGIVEGLVSGQHRSPFRGFSVEFAEHREYTPGDDLRYVDWKVFGRTDRYFLKRFEEETNLSCYLVVDCSRSMSYRSDESIPSKLEYASLMAACLAYLVVKQRDAVGLVLFDSEIRDFQRSSSQPAHWKELVHRLVQIRPQGTTAIAPVLHDLAERMNRRGVVVVLSDFLGSADHLESGLRHLARQRHDVSLIQVVDPAEQDFAFDEPMLFRGLEDDGEYLGDPHSLRSAYQSEFNQFVERLIQVSREAGMAHQLVRTDRPVEQTLREFLLQRSRRSG